MFIQISQRMLVDSNRDIHAIIWDYDGTLADTRQKNLNVTRKIVSEITARDSNQYPALNSLSSYSAAISQTANWRDLYRKEFHFTDEQTENAGKLWTEYQLKDKTLVSFHAGIPEIIRELNNNLQGIVSQNSHHIITKQLIENELSNYFGSVIGYEEVELKKQKPQPDGLIMCIEELTEFKPGYVLYIGDHMTDTLCASNANQVFRDSNIHTEVISVGAFYMDDIDDSFWDVKPNFKARSTKDILEIINKFN